MVRTDSIYRASGLVLLASLLALGCGGSNGTDSAKADASGGPDGKAMDGAWAPDNGGRDSGFLYATDTREAQDEGSSSGEAGPVIPLVDAGSDTGKQQPSMATIVVLPDTQYYAASYPSVFSGQTEWIVSQKPALNIAAVLHVGDIVDFDIVQHWTVANPAMRKLDNVVPYVVVPGNHDYSNANRASMLDNYFPPSSMPWVTGVMTPGKMDNNYMLVDIGPQKWLILGLEFAPRNSVLAWADTVLKTYAQYPAIVLTHLYLYNDGTRYDINVGGTDQSKSTYQWWNPQFYAFTPTEGINDGELMWRHLVLPNSNVRLVICGHITATTGGARLTSTRPDGTTVHEMLSDYQWLEGENFGFGYLRVVQFDYASKKIQVRTFSPYLNAFLTDDANQFTLDLNL